MYIMIIITLPEHGRNDQVLLVYKILSQVDYRVISSNIVSVEN